MDNMDQEKGMNERGDIVPQGPAQTEVNEVNQQKRPLRRPGFLGKIVNAGLALSMFGSVAALKARAEENVTNPVTPQTTTIDGSTGSPQGAPVPETSAEVEFKPTSRVFIPKVEKNFQETPLRFLTRIERPEHRFTIFNRGKERGLQPGELFDNLGGLRRFGRPDLPLEIYSYDSVAQLRQQSGVPANLFRVLDMPPYDFWARTVNVYDDQGSRIETRQFPPTFESNGMNVFYLRDGQVIEVHVALPTPLPNMTPDPLQIDQIERNLQSSVFPYTFTLDENGKNAYQKESHYSELGQYFREHRWYTLKSNQTVDQAALRMVLK